MHLSEGVLHFPTLVVGYAVAIAGVTIGLSKMEPKKMPFVALFSAAFFVAGTIHIPIGVSSVHLILNGVAGLFLGWAVFPAFLIALILQLLLFSFGGFAVLGINLCIMAIPALMVHYFIKPYFSVNVSHKKLILLSGLAGFIGVAGSALIASFVLTLDGNQAYQYLIGLLLVSHSPVLLIDTLVSISLTSLLSKIRPSFYDDIQ